jgi:arsenate reductase
MYNVLFLGAGNSARSIMAEAILTREGQNKFNAYSAGVQAHTELDRHAVDLLSRTQFDVSAMRPKEWSEFTGEGKPVFDFIFTVCDEATMLPHSMWPGRPVFAHWGVTDPARIEGNGAQVRLAYADAFRMLSNRIAIFVNLPLHSLDVLSLRQQLDSIVGGKMRTATAVA